MKDDRATGRAGFLHLMVIYFVWGSTYLGIRVAVREGSGFPPFTMAALRVFVAALILLVWARFAGERLRLTRREWAVMAGSGVLLWTGGNGLVTWGEQHADSGLAALLVASMPIFAAIIDAALDRRRLTGRLAASLLTGFVGVAALSAPVLMHGTSAETWAVVALLAAPLSWAAGSIWVQRKRPDLGPLAVAATQQICGGVGFLVLILLTREPLPTPTAEAWGAWAYLMLFGSVIAFSSFVRALRQLPINVVMTYAYANPVIAVLLGWLILDEPVTVWTLAGTALVIAGVAGVFRERYRAVNGR